MSNHELQTSRSRAFNRRRAAVRRRALRPLLQGLEDRVVLSTIVWDSVAAPSGGSWSAASNWVGGVVPGAADDAVIDLDLPGKVTVSANASVNSLTTDADTDFTLSGGVFTVAGDSALAGKYTQTGGELTGSSIVTVSGLTTWTSGKMTGSGVTNAEGGMAIGQAGVNGSQYLSGRTLNNKAAATFDASASTAFSLYVSSGGTINNLPGATFSFVTGNATIRNDGGSPAGGTFNNQGTLAKTGETGTATINIPLISAGVINAEAGALALTGGGEFAAASSTNVADGATLQFGGGNFTAAAGSSIAGAGSTRFTSGTTATISGTYNITGGATVTSGTASLVGTVESIGAVAISGGTLNLSALGGDPITIPTLNITGGILTGSSTLTVSGSTTWTSGTMSGAGVTNADGGLTIGQVNPNLYPALSGRTLNNKTAATFTGGSGNSALYVSNGATINNLPGASFSFVADNTIIHNNGGAPRGGTFNNQGTLAKTAGTGTSTINIVVNNTGVINAEAGTLSLTGGGEFAAASSTNVADGATLQFGGGDFTAAAGSSIAGAGSTRFTSGTTTTISGTYNITGGATVTGGAANLVGTVESIGAVAISGGTLNLSALGDDPLTIPTLNITGGILTGSSTLTVTGPTTWAAGTMSGAGVTNADGELAINGSPTLNRRTLNNKVAATFAGNNLLVSNGATINNLPGASFSFVADNATIAYNGGSPAGGTFNNQGTLAKTAGTGTATIDIVVNNTGVISAEVGTLALKRGGEFAAASSANVAAGATLQFGGGDFTVAAGSSIAGAGATRFSGGTTTIRGTYDITGGATVTGGTHNLVGTVESIGGAVAISNGTLNLSVLDGNPITISTLNITGGILTGSSTLTVTGPTTWAAGAMTGSGVTNADGGLTIGQAGVNVNQALSGRTLNNKAAATLAAGDNASYHLNVSNGGTINNLPGASFSFVTAKATIHNNGGAPSGGTFNNQGTLAKTGETGTSVIDIVVNNSGAVNVAVGELALTRGGEFAAASSATVAAGATLQFGGGDFTTAVGSSIAGAGEVHFTSGTTTIAGAYDILAGTTITGGTANFAASASTGSLTQTGGALTGSGTLDVTGMLTWTGGNMSGSGVTNALGGMAIGQANNSNGVILQARTLNNSGAATIANSSATNGISFHDGATFNNLPGATFTYLTDARLNWSSGQAGTFNNQGTLAKTGGTETSTISVALNNSGVINAASGTLDLTGAFSNYSAATKTLTGGSYVVSATLRFNGADVVVNAADITLIGADSKILDTSNDNNDALRNLATNAAGAKLTLRDGRVLTTPGAFANAGRVTVEAGSAFVATGAYDQSIGATNLVDGVLTSTSNSVNINGGTLGGSGTVNGNLANNAWVVPGGGGGVGVLNVVGDYAQEASAYLIANLGGTDPGTGYGQLNASGQATLDGTLFVLLINGFTPGDGDAFEVLGYGSRSGEFAAVVPQNSPPGTTFDHEYQTNALVLNAEVAPVLIRIDVTPANSTLAKGLSTRFKATGTYSDDSVHEITGQVVWASEAPTIASIDSTGEATANIQGWTTITATLGDVVGSTKLTVTAAELVSIALDPADSSLAKGLSTRFKATGTYSDDSVHEITGQVVWASEAPTIASIDSTGEATANIQGWTTITATLGDVVGSTSLEVTAAELVSIALDPADSSLAKGLSTRFKATGTYSDDSVHEITEQVVWASEAPTIASIDSTGEATANIQGWTTITATLGDVVGSTSLEVTAAELVSIALDPADSSLAKGLSTRFKATGTYSDDSVHEITEQVVWASEAPTIASIDSTGEATANIQGWTTITATLGDVVGSTSLEVTAAELVSIALDPVNPTVALGSDQQFQAIGTYTDNTTDDITDQVSWTSSDELVATIDIDGLASTLTAGSTMITAALGDVSVSTWLTVEAAEPAVITGTSVMWGTSGMAALETAADDLRLLPAGRSNTIGWLGINRISITLDKAATLTAADVAVSGLLGWDYGGVTVTGSGTMWLITLNQPINGADRVTLTIGNADVATFTRRLDVLPGDVNDDGVVTMQDAMFIRNGILGITPQPFPVDFLDILGEGVATLNGYNAVRRLIGSRLP